MLIPEAKQAWRFTSVQIMALLAVISALEAKFQILAPMIPEPYRTWAVTFFAVAAIIARLWPQPDATAKARDGKLSTLAAEVLDLKSRLDAARDPVEHDTLRDKLAERKLQLEKLYDTVQISKKTEPTQPV